MGTITAINVGQDLNEKAREECVKAMLKFGAECERRGMERAIESIRGTLENKLLADAMVSAIRREIGTKE